MAQGAPPRSMRTFTIIWVGQLISVIGSGLTEFALGVWVYQTTKSATQFALISLFALLPFPIVSALAGTLVDRWNRRRVMILSDIGAALVTLTLALLFLTGQIQAWHIYLGALVSSTMGTFQSMARNATTVLIVPKEQLGRANGMAQATQAASQLIPPALAGFLVGVIGVSGVMLIDLATFLFAVTMLLIVHIPQPVATAESQAQQGSLLREMAYGWRYTSARPGLLGLVLFFTALNLLFSYVPVLIIPLVLSFAPQDSASAVTGLVVSAGGSGMLAASLLMSTWGGPRRRIDGVYAATILLGLGSIIAGVWPSALLIAFGNFMTLFSVSIINSLTFVILQSKVAPDVQGRVFGFLSTLSTAAAPITYLTAGPLADYVLGPLLAIDGPLAGSVGRVIGAGPGRGIGLLYLVMGALLWLAVVAAYLNPRIRHIEAQVPDAIGEGAATL